MNRRVLAVVVCTFLALVGALVWVPVRDDMIVVNHWGSTRCAMWGVDGHAWVWVMFPPRHQAKSGNEPEPSESESPRQVIRMRSWTEFERHTRWPALALRLALVAAIGGLLALVVRTRAARGAG